MDQLNKTENSSHIDVNQFENQNSNKASTAQIRKQSSSFQLLAPNFSNESTLLSIEEIQKLKSEYSNDYQFVFLIGYPSDVGAYNCESRTGQELGPNSFREIRDITNFPLSSCISSKRQKNTQKQEDQITNKYTSTQGNIMVNVIDMERVKMQVIDCGNIQSVFGEIEQTQNNLREYISSIIDIIPHSIVVVIGGSDDLNFPILQSLCQQKEQQQYHLIRLDPELDIEDKYRKQFDDLEPTFHEHNQSHLRMALENNEIMGKLQKVTFFGLQGHKVSMEQIDKLNNISHDKFEFVFYDKMIRRYQQTEQEKELNLYNPTVLLLDKITKSQQQQLNILVNLDIQSIKSEYVLGVSEPCPAFGFSSQEIQELSFHIGQQSNLRIFTISEYNPAIEKFKTGNLVNAIYHNLLLGITQRLMNEGKIKEIIQQDSIQQDKQVNIEDQNQYLYSSILD